MCGITGFVNFDSRKPSLNLIQKMTDSISYRGPDDQGQEIIEGVAFGNRRLAVIDISSKGHMPMFSDDKKLMITYNGEVYNANDLRRELESKNYRFKSNTDTEVILYLYKEYGSECLNRLDGMFAIAIWDINKNQLFLARDHFGIKPLYYFLNHQVFIFASEIKSILVHPQVKKELNFDALSQYFSLGFGCIASPTSIFKNIYKLPPGYFAILKNHKLSIQSYWDLSKINVKAINLDEAKERTKQLIEASVNRQLVSDVPLGSFLSGGIDSSLISAFAQKYTSKKLNTFSIGFDDKNFDESQYSNQVSRFLNTNHHHQTFKVKTLLDIIPDIINKLDEPLADASILPTFLLSKYTKQFVTVALSGDGGDEIFGGYPTYIAAKLARLFNIFPKSIINLIRQTSYLGTGLINLLPFTKHMQNLSTKNKLEKFFNSLDKNLAIQHLNFMGPLNFNLKKDLIIDYQEQTIDKINNLMLKVKNWDQQNQLQYLDFMIYLSEDCLVKTDRASSYNSLEVRPPFLNRELVEFVFSLPGNFKMANNFQLKYLLKKLSHNVLPDNIISRPKKGFGIPIHKWLKDELKPLLEQKLNKKRINKQGLFNYQFIENSIYQHQNNIYDHRQLIWNLLIFQLWWDKWMQ